MGMFDDLRIYRVALNADLKTAPFFADSFWTRYMGFIGLSSPANEPKSVALGSSETKNLSPTGKPIEVLTNFMADGGTTMDIPLINRLTNQPLYDTQLLNNEEESKLTYLESKLHIYRQGVVVQDSKMGVQKNDAKLTKAIMGKAQGMLKDYFSRLIPYQPYPALLEGYSDNLTAATTTYGGAGVTAVLHPNFYVAGTTRPTWSATPATWATNIGNALATLSDDSTKRMSAEMVKSMVRQASALKIRPATKVNGKLLYDIVMSEAGAFDLSKDEEFRTAMNYAYMGSQEKARLEYGQLDGMVFFNAIIHVDQNMPDAKVTGDTGWDSTKTVSFGNTNYMANPLSTGNKKLAILFGASAVVCGYAKPLSFEQETWDYKYKKTEGADIIIGFERADIYDRDGKFGTAGFKENCSSLVVAHWGDDTVTSF
jgi:hypothetical protein